MMFRTRLILLALLLFVGVQTIAKTLVPCNMQLANNAVLAMYQDDDGNMWVGTYDGLHLYDGKNTSVFRMEIDNENSLCSNIVQRIVPGEEGYLWIATSLGVNKFSLRNHKVTRSYMQYVDVEHIASDAEGNVLLIVENGYVAVYDVRQGDFVNVAVEDVSVKNVVHCWSEGAGRFGVLSGDGSVQYYSLTHESASPLLVSAKESVFPVSPLRACHDGERLWVVDKSSRLWSYDSREKSLSDICCLSCANGVTDAASTIIADDDEIFVGFHTGALVCVSKQSRGFKLVNSEYRIFCLLKDRFQDIMWVGTDGYGVMMYCEKNSPFNSLLMSRIDKRIKKPVRALHTDYNGDLWIGTKGDGVIRLNRYDRYADGNIPASAVRRFFHEDGVVSNEIYSFVYNSRWNLLWFGASGEALSYYSYHDERMHTLPLKGQAVGQLKGVHQICEMSDSVLYLICDLEGLVEMRFKGRSRPEIESVHKYRFVRNHRNCNEFYAIMRESDSTLLLGLRGGYGVLRFNIRDKNYSFIDFHQLQGRALGDVLSLTRSRSGDMYFGASSGLISVGKSGTIGLRDRRNGMANDMIHGVLEDNSEMLWLSTNKGLVQYCPARNSFHNYTFPDIEVSEFCDDAYWKCPYSGRLFFGGVNGLVWINPHETNTEEIYHPRLRFLNLEMADGSVIPLSDFRMTDDGEPQIRIPASVPRFQIAFVATDYIRGDNYEYSFRLKGFSEEWVELQKENSVSFSGLPAGNYLLEVRYKSNVDDISSEVYTLPFTVLPPWYRTWWAILCYILLLCGAVWGYIHWLRSHYRRKQSLVVARLEEEHRKKIYEARTNFFVNISHELCTPLTLINGMNERIAQYVGEDERMSKFVDVMRENVRGLNDLIQEIINFKRIEEDGFGDVKISHVPVGDILHRQLSSFEDSISRNGIRLHAAVPDELCWDTDAGLFKKIAYNLLSNAMKYTPIDGEIWLSVDVEEDNLRLTVRNSGKGIPPEQMETLFDRYKVLDKMDRNMYTSTASRNGLGLYVCHGLVEALKGTIAVKSNVGEYAEFVVSLPRLEINVKAETDDEVPNDEPKLLFGLADYEEPVTDKPLVLIVDDNKDIVWLMEQELTEKYRVVTANSVNEAMRCIETEAPDLIVTDVIMPDQSGLVLISNVRNDKYLCNIPIVVVSAKSSENEQVEGFDQGADAYLPKPFSMQVLCVTIARLIESRNQLKAYYNTPESAHTLVEGVVMHQTDKVFMDAVVEALRQNLESESLNVESIADHLGLSPRNFYRKLKKISGYTPSDFIKEYRLDYSAKLLTTTHLTIQEVMYKVGISNRSYFSREFQKKFCMRPKEYRERMEE